MSGVLILSLSAVIVKIIGLLYKIPMLRLLGSEGMGYFNSAYELYALFCTVATTGLPVAMSVLISSGNDGEKVFRHAIRLFLLLGGVSCGVMIGFSRPFADFLGSENAIPCIVAIAPTALIICIISAYRGFFQGKSMMKPTALSQMIEALGKLALGVFFAFLAIRKGSDVRIAAASAALGLTFGEALALLYLVISKRRGDKSRSTLHQAFEKGVVVSLLRIAIPVTLSSAVISLTKVIDMAMILRRLQDMGYGASEAFGAYGNYTTLALPLFSLAPALVSAIAMPLIPALSSAISRRDEEAQRKAVSDAVRLNNLIAMPISAGLVLFARPILELLFKGESAAIEMSFPLLSCLGLSVTMSCLITVENAILQAYGSPGVPIISMAVGSVIKLIVAYLLIGNAEFGIMGAPISTFLCDLVINAINVYFISRRMNTMPGISEIIIRPFAASLVAVIAARICFNMIESRAGSSSVVTLCAVAVAAIIYLPMTRVLGALKKEDFDALTIKSK